MSTELTTVSEAQEKAQLILRGEVETQFLAFSGNGDYQIAASDNGEAGLRLGDLTKVKTPSAGGVKWEIDDGLGNVENVEEITGALVLYQKRGVLWPTEGDAAEGTRPVLVSYDMETAFRPFYGTEHEDLGDLSQELLEEAYLRDGDDGKPVYDLSKLAYNQWGSAGRGTGGKRFKEQRILGILRPEDVLPVIVTVQPGSLANVTQVVRKLTARGVPHWRALVELSLSKEKNKGGIAFSQIHMAVKEVLPLEVGLALRTQFTDPLKAAVMQKGIEDAND